MENRGIGGVMLYRNWNGNGLDCEDSVERALNARVAVAWTQWKDWFVTDPKFLIESK